MSQAGEVFFKVENTGDTEFNLTVPYTYITHMLLNSTVPGPGGVTIFNSSALSHPSSQVHPLALLRHAPGAAGLDCAR